MKGKKWIEGAVLATTITVATVEEVLWGLRKSGGKILLISIHIVGHSVP